LSSLTPHPTQYTVGHFGGGLHSQPLGCYGQTNNKENTGTKYKSQKIHTETQYESKKINNYTYSRNKTTLVQSPLTTLGQETRWAYSTMALSATRPSEAESILHFSIYMTNGEQIFGFYE